MLVGKLKKKSLFFLLLQTTVYNGTEQPADTTLFVARDGYLYNSRAIVVISLGLVKSLCNILEILYWSASADSWFIIITTLFSQCSCSVSRERVRRWWTSCPQASAMSHHRVAERWYPSTDRISKSPPRCASCEAGTTLLRQRYSV